MEIKEAFANLAQSTSEDRAAVTNLTDANLKLTTQVTDHANNMSTKDVSMATIQKRSSKSKGKSRP